MTWSSAGYEYCVWNSSVKYPLKTKHIDNKEFDINKIKVDKEKTVQHLKELIKYNDKVIKEYNANIKTLSNMSEQINKHVEKLIFNAGDNE